MNRRKMYIGAAPMRGPPPMPGSAMARWLLCPVLLVVANWALLSNPTRTVAVCPQLWTVRGVGVTDVLPPHPKNRTQAFDLGKCLAQFEAICDQELLTAECGLDILKEAGDVLGSAAPLTKKQLLASRQFIEELDAQMSIVDRVLGFFSFVNIMWLVAILGITATVVPALAYLFGPMVLRLASTFIEVVIEPVVTFMHRNFILEAASYFLAFTLSVQGSRYSTSQADAGTMVALSGGLAFLPLWGYSTSLHTRGPGNNDAFTMLTSSLVAGNLIPLAILHDSRLIGFACVLALYIGLDFAMFAMCGGFVIGFDGEDKALRCLVASVILDFTFITLKIARIDSNLTRPFATGAMVFGTVMYFLVLLIKSSQYNGNYYTKSNRYTISSHLIINVAMLGSLIFAALIGSVFGMQSLTNTACSFAVLWVMQKESEVSWGAEAILVIFMNFVFLYFVANFLHTHPEYVLAMFDPSGVFL